MSFQQGLVGDKLLSWWLDARHTPERVTALRMAFERFVQVGAETKAVQVAVELLRMNEGDLALAEQLEQLALSVRDLQALTVAHDLLTQACHGAERGVELLRQAEMMSQAGADRRAAFEHGEEGLSLVPVAEIEPLLERLALLAPAPSDVVDLYERQVSRAKSPSDRVQALARAAHVAAVHNEPQRVKTFYELALSGAPEPEQIASLQQTAQQGDAQHGGETLRRALANALAQGGQGARDGGRTRAALLRAAANFVQEELHDTQQAFAWLRDSLIAHVDSSALDDLETLGLAVGEPQRTEEVLSAALAEVFDGPMVRLLLARRAELRLSQLSDRQGAAADLKKLHELSPQDHAILEQLAQLYIELDDFRALVSLYEDQILRVRDVVVRAELARKVARLWEEQLQDAREAADAWRRVLRMKAGDEEATAGLDRAKSQKLQAADDARGSWLEHYAPPQWSNEVASSAARSASRPPTRAPQSMSSAPPRQPSVPPRQPSAPPPAEPPAPPIDTPDAQPTAAVVAAMTHTSGMSGDDLSSLADELRRELEEPASTRDPIQLSEITPAGGTPIAQDSVLDPELASSLAQLGSQPVRPSQRPPYYAAARAPQLFDAGAAQSTSELSLEDVEEIDDAEEILEADAEEIVDADDLLEVLDD